MGRVHELREEIREESDVTPEEAIENLDRWARVAREALSVIQREEREKEVGDAR